VENKNFGLKIIDLLDVGRCGVIEIPVERRLARATKKHLLEEQRGVGVGRENSDSHFSTTGTDNAIGHKNIQGGRNVCRHLELGYKHKNQVCIHQA
jgi:hypothetical protein